MAGELLRATTTEQRILHVLTGSERALTVREVMVEVGLKSPSTAHRHLLSLERQGLIRKERGFVLVRDKQ